MADDIRANLPEYPEVTQVVSQMGRPDDGTDVSTFNNVEFMVNLKNPRPVALAASRQRQARSLKWTRSFTKYPGVDFNFSQNIQDNVEEAMSGVKGENSLKIFGNDFDSSIEKADEDRDIMEQVPGIADVGVFDETGQPSCWSPSIAAQSGRYGLSRRTSTTSCRPRSAASPVTQIIDGDRRFDFAVRYSPQFRSTPEADPPASCCPRPTAIRCRSAWSPTSPSAKAPS